MTKNQKSKWMEILRKDKNFNLVDFNSLLQKNYEHEERTLIEYRNILLQQPTCKNFTLSRENIETLFLEPLTQHDYKIILKGMKLNKWTLEQLCEDAKESGNRVLNIVTCRNIQ